MIYYFLFILKQNQNQAETMLTQCLFLYNSLILDTFNINMILKIFQEPKSIRLLMWFWVDLMTKFSSLAKYNALICYVAISCSFRIFWIRLSLGQRFLNIYMSSFSLELNLVSDWSDCGSINQISFVFNDLQISFNLG